MVRTISILLTALTGFSGLVYEIAWQKYLATLLGSHSEASAAVLGIFLGGLSVGYSLFGALTRRVVERAAAAAQPPKLLLLYGAIEFSIGVFVMAFPWLFRLIQSLSFAIPHGPAGVGFAIDVALAALLVGPPAILMGGTIPILTQALSRSLDEATRFHAFVYAFNTAGAFAGALAAGFYLVPRLGLRDVMLAMGVVNLLAGSVFVALGLRGRDVASLIARLDDAATPRVSGFRSYATVALLTGFAMMTIQTAVIRLASMAFGSSQFTFSIVVAVFVLAIAVGSFCVSAFTRIPTRVVVINQCALAALVVLLYPMLGDAPYWVHVLRTLFRDSDAAFWAFYASSFLLLVAVLGVPVLLSGAALPLLFHHMRREVGHLGDLAGYLYSWNTVGSLLGALAGGYALFFWLDLDQIYLVAGAALIAAAVILGVRVYGAPAWALGALLPLCAVLLAFPAWDREIVAVGLVRERSPKPYAYVGPSEFLAKLAADQPVPGRVIAHTDDPTTSVIVQEWTYPDGAISRSIVTDGKGDGDTKGSYLDYALLAALPAMFADKVERAFVVGWGIGITAGELASFDTMQRVDVAEISRGVLEFAPLFDFANQAASRNPKIHLIQSDAYRALMRSDASYDLIVSQPSHVWVSGAEMLFSREFLQAARSKLSPGGVYCQWLQGYEIGDEAVEIVLRTYASVFENVAIWHTASDTLVLLGFDRPGWSWDHFRLAEQFERRDFRATLARAGIASFPALLAHEVLPAGVLAELRLDAPLHTLFHPRLNEVASRGFFRSETGWLPFTGYGEPARLGRERSILQGYESRFGGRLPEEQRLQLVKEACRPGGKHCDVFVARWLSEQPDSPVFDDVLRRVTSVVQSIGRDRLEQLAELFVAPERQAAAFVGPDRAEQAAHDFVDFYHHGAAFEPRALRSLWGRCSEAQRTRESCMQSLTPQARAVADADEIERLVESCTGAQVVGERCRQGLEWAERLVAHGEYVPIEEAMPAATRLRRMLGKDR